MMWHCRQRKSMYCAASASELPRGRRIPQKHTKRWPAAPWRTLRGSTQIFLRICSTLRRKRQHNSTKERRWLVQGLRRALGRTNEGFVWCGAATQSWVEQACRGRQALRIFHGWERRLRGAEEACTQGTGGQQGGATRQRCGLAAGHWPVGGGDGARLHRMWRAQAREVPTGGADRVEHPLASARTGTSQASERGESHCASSGARAPAGARAWTCGGEARSRVHGWRTPTRPIGPPSECGSSARACQAAAEVCTSRVDMRCWCERATERSASGSVQVTSKDGTGRRRARCRSRQRVVAAC